MLLDADLDQLVERARRDKRDGYTALIQACHVPVRALLAVLVHDRDEADDLAQQTFVFAYEHLHEYRIGTRFLAWLKAIARNLAMDFLKRRALRQISQERFLRPEIARRSADLAGTEAREARIEQLQHCVERLPDAQRSFLRQAHDRRSTLDALSRRMQRSAPALRKQISRLYELLRNCMDRRPLGVDAAP